jgi:hypothetical protein
MLSACSPKRKHVEVINANLLAVDTTFNELSDSSFVPNQVMNMAFFEDDLYFSDYTGCIILLDKQLRFKRKIGSRGQGPGELLYSGYFYVISDDSIYVLHEAKRTFELFVNGRNVGHTSVPDEIRLSGSVRFFVHNQFIFHSLVSGKNSVAVFDSESQTNQFICNFTPWDKPDLTLHSCRHLLKGEDAFFVIGYTLPIFQVYSFEGKLLKDYDLTQIPEIRKVVQKYQQTPQVPTTYAAMITDVYYDQGKVYLLVGTYTDEYSNNTLCVLDVKEDIRHIHTFKLQDRAYRSFCVKDNTIAASNITTAGLDFFTIP